jgi:hypothetical protein
MMRGGDQDALMAGLLEMPDVLDASFGSLSDDDAARPGPDGVSPVEICWHLADLEAEGYNVRINRLLGEEHPRLPDFDGAAIARNRNYRRLPLGDALNLFRYVRRANVAILRRLTEEQWKRSGTQEGVGPVALCDVPAMMAQHDASHRKEVTAWVANRVCST